MLKWIVYYEIIFLAGSKIGRLMIILCFCVHWKHENTKLIIPVYGTFCSIIRVLQYSTIPIIRSLKYAKISAISINDSNMKFQIRYDYTDTFLI